MLAAWIITGALVVAALGCAFIVVRLTYTQGLLVDRVNALTTAARTLLTVEMQRVHTTARPVAGPHPGCPAHGPSCGDVPMAQWERELLGHPRTDETGHTPG